ncbi:MAG: hypothetical protein Q7R99_02895 [bacterium]|nr:hypothetical protein [bacterium]
MNENIFEKSLEFSPESGTEKLERLNDILAEEAVKEAEEESNIPKDFLLSELQSSEHTGAFSRLHFLGENFVVKERLSDIAFANLKESRSLLKPKVFEKIARLEKQETAEQKKETLEQVLALRDKLDNNRLLCRHYFPDNVMDGHYVVKDNKSGLPAIFFIQEKLPEDCLFLHLDQLDVVVDDETRTRFVSFVAGLKNMFRDFGLIIDFQTLDNIAYSPSKQQFYAFDFDPLIPSPECEKELHQRICMVEPFGNKEIKTFTGNSTRSESEISCENLETLERIILAEAGQNR